MAGEAKYRVRARGTERSGKGKGAETNVETNQRMKSNRGNRDEGSPLKKREFQVRTNDWRKKAPSGRGKQERRHSYGREEHEPRGVTCQSSPRGNDSRSRGISMG